jgi:hypothetical protein
MVIATREYKLGNANIMRGGRLRCAAATHRRIRGSTRRRRLCYLFAIRRLDPLKSAPWQLVVGATTMLTAATP